MIIWKFVISRSETIDIPTTHKILSVGIQEGRLVVWALVDPMTPKKPKKLSVIGTGWVGTPMDEITDKRFVGTVQDGSLVFHIFE